MEKEDRNIATAEENARKIRIDLGLTQKQFGDILGISKSYVSDIENGYTGLKINQINKICNYASVSFDYILGFSKKVNKNIIKIKKINLKVMGSKLKAIRKELNFTQEKLASKLSITRTMIAHYEKGIRTIKTEDLIQVCEISGYSADYIVGKLKEKAKIDIIKKIKPKDIKKLLEV